ncbi:MAG TPA: glycosyltransferase family 2 protein, partial [Candidatus Dormibacteraeota bacterium]|nr:glycosyltransferase family 2 protein [Candidatus Dormibacteraeota bacterium]
VWSAGGALRRPWMENHHIGRDEPAASHSISRRVDWATGCAFFCAVETYERVGRLDEGFFLYLEDLDWCLRAARRRVEVWYIPEAVVQHEVSATTRHLPRPEVLYYGCRNTYRVAFRHNGRWRRFAMLPGFLITLARVAGRNATSSSYRRDAFYRARSLAILDFALGRTGACPASVPGVGAVPAAHGAKA